MKIVAETRISLSFTVSLAPRKCVSGSVYFDWWLPQSTLSDVDFSQPFDLILWPRKGLPYTLVC